MTAPASKALTAMASTAARRQLPRILVRSAALKGDNLENVALDCHMGDGSVPLTQAAQSMDQLKDIVDGNQLSGVVLSWPAQENRSMKHLSRQIMNNLDSSFNGMHHETLTTTRPFFMLDGQGRRLASMCLVRGQNQAMTADDPAPTNNQAPGTWLRQYSSSRVVLQ